MSVLVIAEHDNSALKAATLHAVTAAREIADKAGGDVHILVAGNRLPRASPTPPRRSPAWRKVLLADDPAYDHGLAENIAPLIVRARRELQRMCWRRPRHRGKTSCRASRRCST